MEYCTVTGWIGTTLPLGCRGSAAEAWGGELVVLLH